MMRGDLQEGWGIAHDTGPNLQRKDAVGPPVSGHLGRARRLDEGSERRNALDYVRGRGVEQG